MVEDKILEFPKIVFPESRIEFCKIKMFNVRTRIPAALREFQDVIELSNIGKSNWNFRIPEHR